MNKFRVDRVDPVGIFVVVTVVVLIDVERNIKKERDEARSSELAWPRGLMLGGPAAAASPS